MKAWCNVKINRTRGSAPLENLGKQSSLSKAGVTDKRSLTMSSGEKAQIHL